MSTKRPEFIMNGYKGKVELIRAHHDSEDGYHLKLTKSVRDSKGRASKAVADDQYVSVTVSHLGANQIKVTPNFSLQPGYYILNPTDKNSDWRAAIFEIR